MKPRRRAARDPRGTAGFNLVEVLVALLVLGVVAAISLPIYLGAVQRARETAALAYLRRWPPAQEAFFAMKDRYAASLEELVEAGSLVRVNSGQIGYDFGVAAAVAGQPGGTSAQAAGALAAPSWWSRLGPAGTAWADGGGERSGRNGGDDGQREDAPAPSQPAPALPPGSSNWEGWASPRSGRGRYFYVDRTKVIRYAEGGPAGRTSPEIPER